MTIHYKKDSQDQQFLNALRQRVNLYFKANALKKTGTTFSYIKAALLLTAYVLAAIAVFYSSAAWQLYLCYALMGNLTIFVALNIAHDAAHSTFSSRRWMNDLLLYALDALGANGYIWKLKHVHSHHPHVNIPDMDGDIKQSNLVRIFPNARFLKFHRFQYLYMPVLYAFYTLIWLCIRDFKDFFSGTISGKPDHQHPRMEYVKLFLGKALFFSRMLLLPYWLLPFSFGQILLGFLFFHVVASYTTMLVLISAHIGEHSVYPAPDADGQLPHSWIRHQLITTTDFATGSWLATQLFGGFNHHVVHHIFPNICHVHYPQITKILIQTCHDFGMPYQSTPTFASAALSHLRFLKLRSQQNRPVAYPDDM